VIVDLDRAEANITKLQRYLDSHGIANRPHIKTHKLPLIAHLQMAAGATGITVQTLGEAEVMVASGLDDVLITYNLIGNEKVVRLARLARMARVRVAVDNAVALDTVAAAASRAGTEIGVLIEFESGKRRQGVLEPNEALKLAREATSAGDLRFLGLLTYPSSPAVAPWIASARERFDAAGIPIHVVSAGGTPGMWHAHEIPGLTEYRAGTSIYHDRKSVANGSADLDECALHVHTTVVSMPTSTRGVIDAGSKTLTSDRVPPETGDGYGLILEYPDAVITELSEEHGVVDFSACPARPDIGHRLRIVPNHVCPVSNLVDDVYVHRGGSLLARIPVAARGKH
jgi:D-serine deaminase-like pyridoxal phosphate-dependent protein